jgi:nitroimidazol reductase NimA-like FMN-containing flavoprotein (pyridoxamine 5'-phosphate oxidase superfamily)
MLEPMLIDEGLELLTEEQAFDLLEQAEVGRVGVTIGALPAIFPVNYRMIDGAIVFRTAPGSKLTAASNGAVVAFEVDDHDRVERAGWSVLVVGQSEVVHDLDVTFKVLDADLEPYAEGARTAIVRIEPSLVSGRRIIHGDHASGGPINER